MLQFIDGVQVPEARQNMLSEVVTAILALLAQTQCQAFCEDLVVCELATGKNCKDHSEPLFTGRCIMLSQIVNFIESKRNGGSRKKVGKGFSGSVNGLSEFLAGTNDEQSFCFLAKNLAPNGEGQVHDFFAQYECVVRVEGKEIAVVVYSKAVEEVEF